MIEQSVLDFLQAYILKKDEQLDLNNAKDKGMVDLPIVKRTERTYRVLGILTLSVHDFSLSDTIDENLQAYRFTPKKRVLLDDQRIQVKEWIDDGWIMKEVRFKKDGKTVEAMHYRMGYRLYQHEENQKIKKQQAKEELWLDMETNIEQLSFDLSAFSSIRKEAMIHLNKLALQMVQNREVFLGKWTEDKQLRFLHFVVALLQISSQNRDFDWKEIGALYKNWRFKSI